MFANMYLSEVASIAQNFDCDSIENCITILANVRRNRGRLFILGIGGSAGTASHAVNDFRKIAGIESYAPTDNVAELTARTNDDGWHTVFVNWLKTSNLRDTDAVLVISVGGGDLSKNISANLVYAIDYAREAKAKVLAIVGYKGGYASLKSDCCITIPVGSINRVTPHTEEFHSVILHLIVTHPLLKLHETTWEKLNHGSTRLPK